MGDVDRWIEILKNGNILTEEHIVELCERCKQVFLDESHVVSLQSPITVVGDLRGSYHSLLDIFKMSGEIPGTNYVFLGNYTPQSRFGVETISLLLALKLKYSSNIHLLRGNHDCKELCHYYGLHNDIQNKYEGLKPWKALTEVFDYLPLTAVVDREAFCVGGGLSPSIETLEQILEIERVQHIPHEGPMCDLVWSNPDERFGWHLVPRRTGYTFGRDITDNFLHNNGLSLVLRSHEFNSKGYVMHHEQTLISIFSAPNYKKRFHNNGAFIEIKPNLLCSFVVFKDGEIADT